MVSKAESFMGWKAKIGWKTGNIMMLSINNSRWDFVVEIYLTLGFHDLFKE